MATPNSLLVEHAGPGVFEAIVRAAMDKPAIQHRFAILESHRCNLDGIPSSPNFKKPP